MTQLAPYVCVLCCLETEISATTLRHYSLYLHHAKKKHTNTHKINRTRENVRSKIYFKLKPQILMVSVKEQCVYLENGAVRSFGFGGFLESIR